MRFEVNTGNHEAVAGEAQVGRGTTGMRFRGATLPPITDGGDDGEHVIHTPHQRPIRIFHAGPHADRMLRPRAH